MCDVIQWLFALRRANKTEIDEGVVDAGSYSTAASRSPRASAL